jgi:hypothetical protein
VAKLLGDTLETMEKHYAPFVKELRDRVRNLMENDEGLHVSCTLRQRPEATSIKQNALVAGEPVSRIPKGGLQANNFRGIITDGLSLL